MPGAPAMTKLDHSSLIQRMRALQAELRDTLAAHMRAQATTHLARTVRDDDGDTIFGIDVEVEELLLRQCERWGEEQHFTLIAEGLPDAGLEFGRLGRGGPPFRLLVDPIDGTRSFVAGKPLFGTLIGLARGGQPLLGVIDHPATGERWAGHAEGGTSFQGEATRVSEAGQRLSEAIVATTAPHLLREASAATSLELRKDLRDVVYGCDCYAYGLLASGHLHAVVEEDLGVHDWCALVPVVQGAGGIVTDWRGNALRITDPAPDQVIAAATPQLHEELLERFSPHAR